MTIADRIKQKRLELQLSQSDLAVRAEYYDKTRISKIENSGNDISMKQVKRIAKALGVTTAYLMGWESNRAIAVTEPSVGYLVDLPGLPEKAQELWTQYEGLTPDQKIAFENYLKFLQSQS